MRWAGELSPPRRSGTGALLRRALAGALIVAACTPTEGVDERIVELAVPSNPGALAPNVAREGDSVVLSWLEPVEGPGARSHYALFVSSLTPDGWSAADEVVRGNDFFANWADLPAVVALEGAGATKLLAHRLQRLGPRTYDYGVELHERLGDSASWRRLGLLHDDAVAGEPPPPQEHGFVSYAPVRGGVQAFWLDGRFMASGRPMTLRTTRLTRASVAGLPERAPLSTVLDDSVCECCATDAATTSEGPVVVYRDRSADEIRDIAIVRSTDEGWSAPLVVHEDGWRIEGCPVNGPAVAAWEQRVVVAWFTAAEGRPRVLLAESLDGGRSFSAPTLVDEARPVGRVDVAVDRRGVSWVSWMAYRRDGAEVRIRSVGSGRLGAPIVLGGNSGERSSGFPRLAYVDGSVVSDSLIVTWIEDGPQVQRIASAVVSVADRPF